MSKTIKFINKAKLIHGDRYGRKCVIKEITSKEAKEFLNNNHIQGGINAKYNIGLYYNNELVSLMTFGSLRKNMGRKSIDGHYELLRFCNELPIG